MPKRVTAIVSLVVLAAIVAVFLAGRRTSPGDNADTETIAAESERAEAGESLSIRTSRGNIEGVVAGNRGGSGRAAPCTVEQLERLLFGDQSVEQAVAERGELLAPTLAAADDPELVLASALIGQSNQYYAERIGRALGMAPRHPLALWLAATNCSVDSSAAFCTEPAHVANSEDVLGSNGAYWAVVAANLDELGNDDAALKALERATSAPDFDTYFGDQLLLVERALATASDVSYRRRVFEAMTIVAASGPDWRVTSICQQRAPTDDNWLNACLQYGDRLAAAGKTRMVRQMGVSLRQALESGGGDEDSTLMIAVAGDADVNAFIEQNPAAAQNVELWLLADDVFVANFVDQLVTNGEDAAFASAFEEAVRREAGSSADPCTVAGIGKDNP